MAYYNTELDIQYKYFNNIDLNFNRYLNEWNSIFSIYDKKLIWILIKKKHVVFFIATTINI